MIAFAIPGFGSNAIVPAYPGIDPAYNAAFDAFHFATVRYDVVGFGPTSLKMNIGDLEAGVDGPIFGELVIRRQRPLALAVRARRACYRMA